MQVILLDNIPNVGSLGETVKVKAGYARNFLIPNGKVIQATKKNVEFFDNCRAELEAKLANKKFLAEIKADKINLLDSITIHSKVGTEGKLFGSIGCRDIAEAITAAGVHVSKREVRIPNGIIRTTGHYRVNIQVHREICATMNVIVTAKK